MYDNHLLDSEKMLLFKINEWRFTVLIICIQKAFVTLKSLFVELTLGVNLTNILHAAFLYLHFGFVLFLLKNFDAKADLKMLVKLTPGLNFINILLAQKQPLDLR